jgi:Flp pilus assembly pilin Flp
MSQEEVGQGLTEYTMTVSLLSVVAIVGLLLLGPAVGRFLDTVGYQLGTAGVITGVIAERAGHGQGNTVHVTVGVARDTMVTVHDAQSGETVGPDPCRGSCLVILAGVGPAAGTVTVTTNAGHTASTEYPARP